MSDEKDVQPSGGSVHSGTSRTEVGSTTMDEVKVNNQDINDEVNDEVKVDDSKPPVTDAKNPEDDVEYPTGIRLILITLASFVTMFLVSLDRLIITTAIPAITDDFNSVTDIGWYGSAYLMTNCAFQLLFGKVYMLFSIKATVLFSIVLFEVGSAVCGAAPSSVAFIIGRAIAGLGSAGILTGVMTIIVYAVPLHKRAPYQGLFGAVFGVASVVGPLLGGAFTTKVSWRWCFYINLPIGGAAAVVVMLLLKIPERASTKGTLKSKLLQLDVFGTCLIVPACICLVLALQWGGAKYAWSNGRVVALLVIGALLLIGFVLVQIYMPKTATIAPRVFKGQRSVLAALISATTFGAHMMIIVYYLPIWFQAIEGVSALDSGIRTIPLVLSMVFSMILCGFAIRKIGYFTPFLLAGVCIMSAGSGLMTTLKVNTTEGQWIGYQILYGFGMGISAQVPNLATQVALPKADIPMGIALMFFGQLLGGAIFTSVGQNVLDSQLLKRLAGIPGLSPEKILNSGATSIVKLPASIKPRVLVAYNQALRHVFIVGLIMVCISIIGAALMEWKTMKQDPSAKQGQKQEDKQEKGEAEAKDQSEVKEESV